MCALTPLDLLRRQHSAHSVKRTTNPFHGGAVSVGKVKRETSSQCPLVTFTGPPPLPTPGPLAWHLTASHLPGPPAKQHLQQGEAPQGGLVAQQIHGRLRVL